MPRLGDNRAPVRNPRSHPKVLPWYEKSTREALSRRLLLISYHFPPAQTAGALRWEKLSHYAAEHGWAMDVVTLHPASLVSADATRLEGLPAGIRVYGIPDDRLWVERVEHGVWRGYRRIRGVLGTHAIGGAPTTLVGSRAVARADSLARSEIRWTLQGLPQGLRRAYSAWVDHSRQARWARAAADLGLRLSRLGTYEAVVSCGPPHIAHEGGRRAAMAMGVPHVMDLRDPWSLVQRLPESIASPVGLAIATRFERRTIARAALVVANTEPSRLALQERYPEARSRIITVMNGYDEDPVPRSRHGRRFTIAYAGTIYLDRDPRMLFRAAACVVRELALEPADFHIVFMGEAASFDGVPTDVIARKEGLDGFFGIRPPASRRETIEFLADATVLFSLPQDSDMAIPSKIFEYMRHDAWILAIAERDSAIERLLRGRDADVVAPRDLEGLTAVLRKRYLQYARGEHPRNLTIDPSCSRREQARKLFEAIQTCVARDNGVVTSGRGLASAMTR
jgi:hypothetical protein